MPVVGAPCPNWGTGCTCDDCTFPGEPPYVSGVATPSLVVPFGESSHRQGQYEAMLRLMQPGERLHYTELLDRMKGAGEKTDGIGMTLADLSFRGHKQLWRGSEIVSYREPYYDHEHEGDWTEGTLYVARAEARDESLWT